MKKFLMRALPAGIGVALGTLIYQRWFGVPHDMDWGRAIVIGAVSGTLAALLSKSRNQD